MKKAFAGSRGRLARTPFLFLFLFYPTGSNTLPRKVMYVIDSRREKFLKIIDNALAA
jgi:hypothetical protein